MKPTLPSPHVRIACGLATLIVAVAFLTSSVSGGPTAGNIPLGPSTWSDIALILIGAGLGIWALLRAGLPRRLHWGSIAVVLFIAVAALTALSVSWSVAPDQSWLDAERTAAYVAIFAGAAICARQLPDQWQAVASAIAIATIALSSWALLVKIFNWPLYQQPSFGRLTSPFGYWNATGVIAAMGLPATIWVSARRRRNVLLRGLAVPGIAVLLTVVVLSYSRSAVLAAVLGLAVPLLLSELKLRSVFNLGLGAIGAAIISVWALTNNNLSADSYPSVAKVLPHAARSSSGRDFGIVVVIVLVIFTFVGIASARWADGVQLTVAVRKRLHMLLALGVAMVPVLLVIALAFSSRGIGGEVSHVWDTLTQTSAGTTDSAHRLATLSNSRPSYWHQAFSVFKGHPLAGAGADTFDPALLKYPTATLTYPPAQRAHSYIFQTLADFGAIGAVLNLALLLSWGRAAVRTFAYKGWPGQGSPGERTPRLGLWGSEREGALALLGVVVAFGASSAIDWTWFYPGVAAVGLTAAGWLAGRGPLNREADARAGGRRRRSPQAAAFAAGAAVAIVALLACWFTLQPLRAQNAYIASQAALSAGNGAAALDSALAATRYLPDALDNWHQLAQVYYELGLHRHARAALVRGTEEQPGNPMSWYYLGLYQLCAKQYPQATVTLTQAWKRDITEDDVQTALRAAKLGTQPAFDLCPEF